MYYKQAKELEGVQSRLQIATAQAAELSTAQRSAKAELEALRARCTAAEQRADKAQVRH